MAIILPKYLYNNASDTAVVFVHGLGGSYTTWDSFSNKLHTEWNEETSFGLEYDIYYGNSNIPIYNFLVKNIFGKSIERLAEHLDGFVRTVCDRYSKVILVCHSMGGLVARKYILNTLNKTRNLGKIKALITYATPHHGSRIANVAMAFLRNPIYFLSFGALKLFAQHNDLSKNSDFIKNLNSEWSNLNVSSKLDFLRVVGMADWIVDEPSAEYESDNNVIKCANKNHFTIIKPDSVVNDNALFVTYNYLRKFHQSQIENEGAELNEENVEENEFDY